MSPKRIQRSVSRRSVAFMFQNMDKQGYDVHTYISTFRIIEKVAGKYYCTCTADSGCSRPLGTGAFKLRLWRRDAVEMGELDKSSVLFFFGGAVKYDGTL